MRHEVIARLTRAIDLIETAIGNGASELNGKWVANALDEIKAVRIEIESRKAKYPTLEEVKLLAAKAGLPDIEAEKFYYHFESNGWKVSKNPMKSIGGCIGTWKLNWQERTHQPAHNGYQAGVKVRERFQIERDIAGIQRRIAEIRANHGQYLEAGTWQGARLPDDVRANVKNLIEAKKKLQAQYDQATI